MTEGDWQDRVKGLLKAELKRRNIGYKELAQKLGKLGIHESDRNKDSWKLNPRDDS